jgi:hypothetical protein
MDKNSIGFLNLLIFFLFCGVLSATQEEDKEKSPVQLSGSLGFYDDFYSFSQENYSDFRARYTDNLLKLNAPMSLKLGKHFSTPICMNVTHQRVLYNLPSAPKGSALDYLQNPANNISVNLKYKWGQALLKI